MSPENVRPAPSDKPLAAKLGFKDGCRYAILFAPSGYKERLAPLPAGCDPAAPGEPADLVQLFVGSQADLQARLPGAKALLKPDGKLWVTWRKGGKTDVSRDNIWPLAGTLGLTPVSNVAIDDEWSALRFKIVP
jgi:hypothetical protein